MNGESIKKRKERVLLCLQKLRETYGEVACGLNFENDPWKLLVMGILAAQCTDKRVNTVATTLFKQFPAVADFAAADVQSVAQAIASCGLYQRKAEHIVACARLLEENFNSQVPSDMDALLTLPGVGRKIANLVRSDYFALPGMVVDTHNMRLSARLGFSRANNPTSVEKELVKIVPENEWTDYGHYMVEHGRNVCSARKAACADCCLRELCPSAFKETAGYKDKSRAGTAVQHEAAVYSGATGASGAGGRSVTAKLQAVTKVNNKKNTKNIANLRANK